MGTTPYGYQLGHAEIDCATAGDHTVVAAVTNQKIRVVSLFLHSDDVVTIQFKSDTTGIGGTIQLTDGDEIILGKDEYGHFQTATGEALVLTLSADKQISGWLGYFLVT